MTTKQPERSDIPALRQLWKAVFKDTDELLDGFFAEAFSPERSLCVWEDDKIVAMLYWFDCTWREKKIAYVYAVATDENYRGRGICQKLMDSMHRRLQKQGYYGSLLIPGEQSLVAFYQKMGYEISCTKCHFSIRPAGEAEPTLHQISWQEYARLRAFRLPEDRAEPDETAYRYMDTYMKFYSFSHGIFCGTLEQEIRGNMLRMQEYLGDPRAVLAVGVTLNCREVEVRLDGGAPFEMFRSLTEDKTMPKYFGLPMD